MFSIINEAVKWRHMYGTQYMKQPFNHPITQPDPVINIHYLGGHEPGGWAVSFILPWSRRSAVQFSPLPLSFLFSHCHDPVVPLLLPSLFGKRGIFTRAWELHSRFSPMLTFSFYTDQHESSPEQPTSHNIYPIHT